jgi:O-succinylbenzoic acid--CoA ligase
MEQALHYNGTLYAEKALKLLAKHKVNQSNTPEWEQQIMTFLLEWLNDKPYVEVKTSGTTGPPKLIRFQKQDLLRSAELTQQFFGYHSQDTAGLVLPVSYIAGKMMLVRALHSGLQLVAHKPSSDPWQQFSQPIDFMAVLPMQLHNLINHPDQQSFFKTILVGGAPMDDTLIQKCQTLEPAIYQSYGMTETLTHVAVRRLNGPHPETCYHALSGISFRQSDNGTLIIQYFGQEIETSDMVDLVNPTTFRWKGRKDHVINSGGIKLFPETLEKKVNHLIKQPCFFTSLPDKRLGEKLVLFIENPKHNISDDKLKKQLEKALSKYERPKAIIFLDRFQYTESGKIKRNETRIRFLKTLS